MRFALVDEQRAKPINKGRGNCPVCKGNMMAKCGDKMIHHWAHISKRYCDHWWENETLWHREWKNQFPEDWQEVIHFDEATGEKHIADVKTSLGWVFEIQHSFLKEEERAKRDSFYKKLIWIVDGKRRKTDLKQFNDALNFSNLVTRKPYIWKVRTEDTRLLKEWSSTSSPVFFDFGELEVLWWLMPLRDSSYCYVCRFPRIELVNVHNSQKKILTDGFEKMIHESEEFLKRVLYQRPQVRRVYRQFRRPRRL
jgi:hypothetical protein